jgi:hypothetical protein
MPNSPDYVWEKMYVAADCMCGKASLGNRLANAAVSALCRLEVDDLEEGELREDLKYSLSWTKDNLDGDHGVKRVPDDLEHARLVEKILHILLETHRH